MASGSFCSPTSSCFQPSSRRTPCCPARRMAGPQPARSSTPPASRRGASSFACGMASLAVAERNQMWTQLALLATGVLGAAFLALEVKEFASLVARGAGPTRSAFLTAFFTLVGCHGLHITAGLLWLGTMMAQFLAKGFRENIRHRFLCFSLFWHALDIIWIAIFSLVYLNG